MSRPLRRGVHGLAWRVAASGCIALAASSPAIAPACAGTAADAVASVRDGVRAIAAAGLAGAPDTGAVRVIDAFDDISGWKAQPADGVELTLHPDAGIDGGAIRLDFRFVKGGGYAVIHKMVSLDLPENYRFRFQVRGRCPSENLEFKLIDASGDNVWWCNQRDFRFDTDWRGISLSKRRIGFAWGPLGGGAIRHVAAIEFAVTAGSGGEGSVWLDQLTLEPLRADSLPPPVPTVTTSSDRAHAAAIVDGDPKTTWSPTAGDGAPAVAVDLGMPRDIAWITLDWAPGGAPRRYDVTVLDDDGRVVQRRAVERDASTRTRDRLFLPAEARQLRLSAPGPMTLAELAVEPTAGEASINTFFEAVARDARRGAYPRAIRGEPSLWTVVGVDADRAEGLLSEDGALEVGQGQFSIEPFLELDGKVITWADVTPTRTLTDGDLPLPTVTWHAKGIDLEIAVVPDGLPGASRLIARYRLVATGSRRRGRLFLAVRPFQVNPPAQFLGTPGGGAPLPGMRFDGARVHVASCDPTGSADTVVVTALVKPDDAGAVVFDQGELVDQVLARHQLGARAVSDPSGHASGAWAYDFEVSPQRPAEFTLVVPLHPGAAPVDGPMPDADARAFTTARFGAARSEWRAQLDRVHITLPDSAQEVEQTLRAQIGWMLVERDSAGLQPGARAYDRSWIRDGAMMSDVLLRLGHADAVREFIDWYADHQYADGKMPCCVDHRGSDPVPEHDSQGEFIELVAGYVRVTHDMALAKRMWPHVAAAAAYLDTLRAQRLTPEWRAAGKEPFYGILPPSISHEGYSAKPMHSYWDDLWALRGYASAAELAGAIGDHDAREHWLAQHDAFAHDLAASVRAAMKAHAIPYVPGCADLGDFDPTSTSIAFDPIQADTVLPAAAVDSTFERYWRFFVDRRDGRQPWDAFTPYEWRNVSAFVELGWRERAGALLAWLMAQRQPPEWRQWPEVVWKDTKTAHFLGDLPHAWVGSDFARAVLDMVAYTRDGDDALVIAAGVPLAWARGAGVTVHGLMTRYGALGYALRARDGRVDVDLEGGLRMPTGGIVVAPPGERRFARARVDDAPAKLDDAGRVTVWKVPASVTFEY